ncbi:sensor histidine kinase, partial [Streptomyces sp. NPDC058964]
MAEQRVRGHGPSQWWRYGPPWWNRPDGDAGPGRARLPWRSTVVLTAFVLVGSNFAAHEQVHREQLDGYARVLLLVASGLLLWRQRYPSFVAFGTAAAALVYLGAGYPYGPVFLTVAVSCFSAVVAGHRRAAWASVGMLWAGHLLVALWLYRWLAPPGGGGANINQEIVIATWVVA